MPNAVATTRKNGMFRASYSARSRRSRRMAAGNDSLRDGSRLTKTSSHEKQHHIVAVSRWRDRKHTIHYFLRFSALLLLLYCMQTDSSSDEFLR